MISQTPFTLLNNKTPYELLFESPLSFFEFHVFSCLCYAHHHKSKRDKFASRSCKCICVGYPEGKKGRKLYDLETRDYFVFRDVKFYKNEFSFAQTIASTTSLSRYVAPNFDHFDFDTKLEHVEDNVSSPIMSSDVVSGPNIRTNCEMEGKSLVCDRENVVENVDECDLELTRAPDSGLIESSKDIASVDNEDNAYVFKEEVVATLTIQAEDEK